MGEVALTQPLPLWLPLGTLVPRKDLRDSAPSDVSHQHPLHLIGRRSPFTVKRLDQFDGREVVSALLLDRTFADSIFRTDAVVPRV